MQPPIHYLHFCDKDKLLAFKASILKLFSDCFQRELDEQLYEWLYLRNPLGSPIINLAFLGDSLVGHYAFIPLASSRYRLFLSATTMVAKSARKYNVFYDLALRSYAFASSHCDLLIGFPNKISAPIHATLLGWNLLESFIIRVREHVFEKRCTNPIELDTGNASFMQWRLSKPHTSYELQDGMILKHYENCLDVMHSGEVNFLPPSPIPYHILTQNPALKQHKIIDYPFAYKAINADITPPPTGV